MSSINDYVKGAGIPENEFDNVIPEVSNTEIPTNENTGLKFDFGWIKTVTGDGDVERYIDHPLNFVKSKGLAQILRGLTGFAGNLNLAVIDVGLGIMNFLKERRKTDNGII